MAVTAEGRVVIPEELPVKRPGDWRHGASSSLPARSLMPCRYRLPLRGEMKCH